MNVKIVLDGENAFPEMEGATRGELVAITALPEGMEGGKTSVAFIGEMEDGSKVFLETSLRIFQTAVAAFTAKYGAEDQNATAAMVEGSAIVGFKDN